MVRLARLDLDEGVSLGFGRLHARREIQLRHVTAPLYKISRFVNTFEVNSLELSDRTR